MQIVLQFWLKMVSIICRNMVPDGKFHKTGGSHIVFIICGTICDEKNIVLIAALPGVFFKPKNTSISMLFNSKFTLKDQNKILKILKIQCFIFICFYLMYFKVIKILTSYFWSMVDPKKCFYLCVKFWDFVQNFLTFDTEHYVKTWFQTNTKIK